METNSATAWPRRSVAFLGGLVNSIEQLRRFYIHQERSATGLRHVTSRPDQCEPDATNSGTPAFLLAQGVLIQDHTSGLYKMPDLYRKEVT